jgi:tryptophan-rich sensory protein
MRDIDSIEKWKYVIILLPNIISFSIFFLTRDSYSDNKPDITWFDPPRSTFFIIWSVLYAYLGYYLYRCLLEKEQVYKTLQYTIILLLSFSYLWMLFYGNDKKKEAIWTFIPLILFSLSTEVQVYTLFNMPSFLFTAWLIFAFVLSSFDTA